MSYMKLVAAARTGEYPFFITKANQLVIYDKISRAKEVAKINHTFVIELKPEKSDTPEAGFDHPENKLEETALEMYDGFVEYMKSFLVDIVDDSIKQECKTKLEDMKREIEGYEEEENYDF